MALVNAQHNFIFFHLYKCGGNSIRKELEKNCGKGKELQGVHSLPKDLEKHFQAHSNQKRFDSMYKFTFVRNPFSFLLSTFHYANNSKIHYMHNDVQGMDMLQFTQYYLKVCESHKDLKIRPFGSNQVTQLYQYIINKDKKVIVDFVGKLENMQEDMNKVCTHLKIPIRPIMKANVSSTNTRPYRESYSKEARKFVEKHFEKDLNYFDYEF